MRTVRQVTVRPLPQSGLSKVKSWMENQSWSEVLLENNIDNKAEVLHQMIINELDKHCPEKVRKIASDDEPWFTDNLKRLDRKCRRQFRLNRVSEKYKILRKKFRSKVSKAKKLFKRK